MVSLFAFALHSLHCTLRAYSGNSFAIGFAYDLRRETFFETVGMFVNTVLYPFYKGDDEKVEDIHRRLVHDVLPVAKVSYDELISLGYGCIIMLAFKNSFHKRL